MRTDDSFYQETYINANVNGVRPYWKNLKVREFLIAVFVFDTRGGGKSETEKKKLTLRGGTFSTTKNDSSTSSTPTSPLASRSRRPRSTSSRTTHSR